MIWLVLPMFMPLAAYLWGVLGIGVITWVDDEQHRLWKWVECPDDREVHFLLVMAWPWVVWKWLRCK